MRFYLSSYKLGDHTDELLKLLPSGNTQCAYISNAMDVSSRVQARQQREEEDKNDLRNLGLTIDHIDLRNYFDDPNRLEADLEPYGLLWICGGNTFALRQAMTLSGFDTLIHKWRQRDVVYGGYSAGCCVLAPTLEGLHIVDDPNVRPYGEEHETIWEGLGIIDFAIAPHYDSDHPESDDVSKEIAYCKEHGIPCKPLRDGEVIIIE